MVHQERLEIGEKCFVSGVLAVLALEATLTIITCNLHFSWPGLLLGVVGFCLILFLANRLYAGNRQANKIALAWIGFQVLYAGFALYLLAGSAHGAEMAAQIGAPAAWPVVLKLLAYLSLGWILMRMPTVRDFFAEKRGDVRAHDLLAQKAAVAPEVTAPLVLGADQNKAVQSLATFLRLGVATLIVAGCLQMLSGALLLRQSAGNPQGALILLQGLLLIILGMALGGPSNEIRPLTTPEGQTTGQLTNAFGSLAKFYTVQIVVGLLLVAVTVMRFVLALV